MDQMRSTSTISIRGVSSSALISAVVLLIAIAAGCEAPRPETGPPPVFVAHAGGVGAHRTDTNSREALDHSVSVGHTVIEVDISWTSDDHLVLFHDWDDSVDRLLESEPGRMSLAGFQAARSRWGLTHLVLDDLGAWLAEHPRILIVTDVKVRNIEALRRIADAFPEMLDRFVPQIYSPEELAPARDLGFTNIILTLYRSELTDDEVVAFTDEHDIYAVTMPPGRARTANLPDRLASAGEYVFVHTVNDYFSFDQLKTLGVYGVYTDWMSPADENAPSDLADWDSATEGGLPLEHRLIPYVPAPFEDLRIQLSVTNPTSMPQAFRLRAYDSRGREAGDTSLRLHAGESRLLDLHRVLPRSAYEGWLRIEAEDAVEVESMWVYRDQPGPALVVAATAESLLVTRGPGTGMGGHLLAIVNPSAESQTYRVSRRIGNDLIDEEAFELLPSHQLIRVFPSRTEEVIEVLVEGGPMLAQTIRWDPFLRTMR